MTQDDKCMFCPTGYIHAVIKCDKPGYEHIHDYCDSCNYRLCTMALGVCEWISS